MFDRNKPYNDLPLLPPGNDIIDTEILEKWGLASRTLANLDGKIGLLPNPGMLVNTLSLQEAKFSSAIENVFTTDDELYKAVSDTVVEERSNPATKEVLRYREALWEGNNTISTSGNIDIDTMIGIYRKVKNTNDGIRPPHSLILIRKDTNDPRTGEVAYTPPRGKDILEGKLTNLIEYLKADNGVDPLIKMAIAHYQFEAIHPFGDGNGRTGRILNLLYLVHKGLLSMPILYLSKYIIDNKGNYNLGLMEVTSRQAWKRWIMFMLDAVEWTSRHTLLIIQDIVSQINATLDYGKSNIGWYNKEINEAIFSQPYIKPAVIGKVTKRKSRTTLTTYMNELVSNQILTPKKDGKEVYYLNSNLIRILEQ